MFDIFGNPNFGFPIYPTKHSKCRCGTTKKNRVPKSKKKKLRKEKHTKRLKLKLRKK